MTEIEEICKDLKAVVDRFNKWYNENITLIHHLHTYPYTGVKSSLGRALTHMRSVARDEEARKK